jgi:hypothetical protein
MPGFKAYAKQIVFRIPNFNITKSRPLFEHLCLDKLIGKISPSEALLAHIEIADRVIRIARWGSICPQLLIRMLQYAHGKQSSQAQWNKNPPPLSYSNQLKGMPHTELLRFRR